MHICYVWLCETCLYESSICLLQHSTRWNRCVPFSFSYECTCDIHPNLAILAPYFALLTCLRNKICRFSVKIIAPWQSGNLISFLNVIRLEVCKTILSCLVCCKKKQANTKMIWLIVFSALALVIATFFLFGKKSTSGKTKVDIATPQSKFLRAAQVIGARSDLKLSTAQKLELYGLYKQATVGDCATSQPSIFDVTAASKWQAWKTLEHMDMKDAEQKYIFTVTNILQAVESKETVAAYFANCIPEESESKPTDAQQEQKEKQVVHFSSIDQFNSFYLGQHRDRVTFDGQIENKQIASVPVRIYTPHGIDAPARLLMYLHGGGWVAGSLDTDDSICKVLSTHLKTIVVSVDYALGKYPEAQEQIYNVVEALSDGEAVALGSKKELMAIAGFDSGANLAAGICLMLKDLDGCKFNYQLLICPLLRRVTEEDDFAQSYSDLANDSEFATADVRWLWNQYVAPEEEANHYACPLTSTESLNDLPNAVILTAEKDPVRDEGVLYAAKLQKSNVVVHYENMMECSHFSICDIFKFQKHVESFAPVVRGWYNKQKQDTKEDDGYNSESDQESVGYSDEDNK